MSDEKKPFTVTDRRHFTRDGEARRVEEPEAESPPPREAPKAPRTLDAEKVDFAEFVTGIAAQAGLLIQGGEEQPADLPAARHMISILEMLKEKTSGRRTREEDEILDALLFELRMAYVARAGQGAA